MDEVTLYLDEDITPTLAVVLRGRGYDKVIALPEMIHLTVKMLNRVQVEELRNSFRWLQSYR